MSNFWRQVLWREHAFYRTSQIGMLALLVLLLAACEPAEGLLGKGSIAPSLKTKTLADVNGDMGRMTSYRYPDKRMYQLSVDEALELGKPILLEFATPGHCTVCDKQLQLLKGLMEIYQGKVLFMHMDQYFNPEAFKAFKVKGDPWTFIIDADKKIVFRQAGRVLYSDLDLIIKSVLKQPHRSTTNVAAK